MEKGPEDEKQQTAHRQRRHQWRDDVHSHHRRCLAGGRASVFASSYAELVKLPEKQIAAIFVPLDRVARAVDSVGKTEARAYYSGVEVDGVHGTMTAYLTDLDDGPNLLALAKKGDPGVEWSRLHFSAGRYTFDQLMAAANRLESAKLPFTWYGMSVRIDGSGIRLDVADPGRAEASADQKLASLGGMSVRDLAGVDLRFAPGAPQVPIDLRTDDVAPFIAGDSVMGPAWGGGTSGCTAGASVVSSVGVVYMLAANHCFSSGTVTTGGPNHTVVGSIVNHSDTRDAELIWADSRADYWSTSWQNNPITSVVFSYQGDVVSQGGYTACQTYGGPVTGITVTDPVYPYQLYYNGIHHPVKAFVA